MFGNNSFTNTSFGAPAASPFGSTTFGANTSLNAFGTSQQANNQTGAPIGTTIRFNPPAGTDTIPKAGSNSSQTVNTRHQNISAMKEYESKSNDELRFEDYAANRKVGQSQTSFGASSFNTLPSTSQQQNTGSIFGLNSQAPSTSIFNQSQPTTNIFGSTPQASNTSIFGQNTTQPTTNLFGAQNPQTSNTTNLFGNTTQLSNSPNLFGNPTQNNTSTSIFGTPTQNQPSTNIFGQSSSSNIFNTPLNKPATTAANSLFNINSPFKSNTTTATSQSTFPTASQPNQTGFSLFNNNNANTTTQTTTPFGASSVNSAFKPNIFSTGTTTGAPSFNSLPQTSQPQSTPSIFGSTAQAPSTSIFSQGTSQPTGGLFGNTNTQTSTSNSLFGATTQQPATSTNLFGNTNTQTSTSNSLFGATTQQPANSTNLFGNPTQNNATTSIFGTPTQNQPSNTNIFGQASNSNIFNTSLNKPATTAASSLFGMNSPFKSNTTTATSQSAFPAASQPNQTGFSLFNNNNNTTTNTQTNAPFGLSNTNSPFNNTTSIFSTANTSFEPPQANVTQNSSNNTSQFLLNHLKTFPYGVPTLIDSSTEPKFTTDVGKINQFKLARKELKLNNKSASPQKAVAGGSVLFDGLDENDDMRCAIDIFVAKKNIKKLDLSNLSNQE